MPVLDLVQKSKERSSFSNQDGQALVEYLLVLVVSVALVIALATQIFTPFRDFLKSYMGDYIACLLETGELPSLGNETTEELLAAEGCNAKFESATLAKGRPARADAQSAAQNPAEKKAADTGPEGGAGGGSPVVGPGSSGRGSNLLISSFNRKTATEAGAPQEKVTEIPVQLEASSFYNRKDSYSSETGGRPAKITSVGIAGLTEEEKKKQARKENSSRVVASGEQLGPPPKKIPVKKPEPKPEVVEEDTPMTFGNFFRFLLIAAIVIALLAVLGGQALKIAKSQEK